MTSKHENNTTPQAFFQNLPLIKQLVITKIIRSIEDQMGGDKFRKNPEMPLAKTVFHLCNWSFEQEELKLAIKLFSLRYPHILFVAPRFKWKTEQQRKKCYYDFIPSALYISQQVINYPDAIGGAYTIIKDELGAFKDDWNPKQWNLYCVLNGVVLSSTNQLTAPIISHSTTDNNPYVEFCQELKKKQEESRNSLNQDDTPVCFLNERTNNMSSII